MELITPWLLKTGGTPASDVCLSPAFRSRCEHDDASLAWRLRAKGTLDAGEGAGFIGCDDKVVVGP